MSFLREPLAGVSLAALLPAIVFAWRNRGADGRVLLSAGAVFYLGLVGASLILGHLYFVGSIPLRAEPGAWTYDFRWYGMLLFGTVVLLACSTAVAAAVGMARGRAGARRRAALAAAVVLATNLPLLPLQEFATAMSTGAALALAAALLAGRAATPPAPGG